MKQVERRKLALLSLIPLAGVYLPVWAAYSLDMSMPDPLCFTLGLLYLPAVLFFIWALSRTGRAGRAACILLCCGHLSFAFFAGALVRDPVTTVFGLLFIALFLPFFFPLAAVFFPYHLFFLEKWIGSGNACLAAAVFYPVCILLALNAPLPRKGEGAADAPGGF